MTTPTIITLTDPYASSERVCDYEWANHGRLPVHVASECHLLAGLNPRSRDVRCSVCGQEWNEGVVYARHWHCAFMGSDGQREAAHPIITYGDVEIRLDPPLSSYHVRP